MWDERYATDGYAYGKEPNDFLRQSMSRLKVGTVLTLAEGEGRNAVFLAQQGYDVTAVDSSSVGLRKGQALAIERGVSVNFVHADLADYHVEVNSWDAIVSIFCPIPSDIRRDLYRRVVKGLRPGGVFLLEAYRPEQIYRDTGGGKNADFLQSASTLREEMKGLEFEHLREFDRSVNEGMYHTGVGAVVQAIAVKPQRQPLRDSAKSS